jgi:hypothetical protein
MKLNTLSSAIIVAVAVAVVGCNNANRGAGPKADDRTDANRNAPDRAAPSDTRNAPTPITVMGCLQEQGSALTRTYVLTRVTKPESVGTSGSENRGTAQRDQLTAAENSYRIDAPRDVKLDELVGKQVSVKGTIAERSDLASSDRDANAKGTAGVANDQNDRRDINVGDLAEIRASSVTKIADQCNGGGAARRRQR